MMIADLAHLFFNTAAFFVALLFLRAAMHKLADRYRFQGILEDYGIMSEKMVGRAAPVIPVLELATVVLLLLPATRMLGAALAATLLGVYAAAIAVNLIRGHYLMDCGCGGAPEPISWLLVARNAGLVLIVAPLASGYVPASVSTLPADGTALAIATLLIVLWLAAEVMLANARRMNEVLPSTSTTWSPDQ